MRLLAWFFCIVSYGDRLTWLISSARMGSNELSMKSSRCGIDDGGGGGGSPPLTVMMRVPNRAIIHTFLSQWSHWEATAAIVHQLWGGMDQDWSEIEKNCLRHPSASLCSPVSHLPKLAPIATRVPYATVLWLQFHSQVHNCQSINLWSIWDKRWSCNFRKEFWIEIFLSRSHVVNSLAMVVRFTSFMR